MSVCHFTKYAEYAFNLHDLWKNAYFGNNYRQF